MNGWNGDDLQGGGAGDKLIDMSWNTYGMTDWGETYAVVSYPSRPMSELGR